MFRRLWTPRTVLHCTKPCCLKTRSCRNPGSGVPPGILSKASEEAVPRVRPKPRKIAASNRKRKNHAYYTITETLDRRRRSGHRRICGDVGSHFGAGGRNDSVGWLQRQQCFFKCCQFPSITTESTSATVIAQWHIPVSANIGSAFRICYSIPVSAPRNAICAALLFLRRRLTVFADVKELRMRH